MILLFLEDTRDRRAALGRNGHLLKSELSTSSQLANATCGSAVARGMAQLSSCCLAKGPGKGHTAKLPEG